MRSLCAVAVLALPILATAAAAADEPLVTNRDRLICTTQASLREALQAIEKKDRQALRLVQGCRYSIDGVPAELLQDNVSMIKVRLGPPEQPDRHEFWTLPDTVKPANKR